MNLLNEDEQEAAVRCVCQVEQEGGQAVEAQPGGRVIYAYRKAAGLIGWGMKGRRRHPLQSGEQS